MRYSGGMAQRLMLARASMHFPTYFFLTSRLIAWIPNHVSSSGSYRSLNEQGATILLTTHDMEEADQLCQRIAIMDHGKILVLDAPSELKKLIAGGAEPVITCTYTGTCFNRQRTSRCARQNQLLDALRVLPGVVKVEEVPALEGED